MDSPTDLLAGYAAEMRSRELSPAVIDKAATCLLDALGLSAARDRDAPVTALQGVIGAGGEQAEASLWPSGRRVGTLDAVLANAFAVHARFHDDNDISSFSHPGSLIVPPSLTLAEAGDRSLEVALRAIVAGYSAMAWLGAGGRVGWTLVSHAFRGSATFGCVGAAVAASVSLGLDRAQACNAVSIAADISGGTVEPVRSGASSRRLQNATAAWRGALAAFMGRAGLDGSADALGGPRGFLHAYTQMDPPEQWSEPPVPELILDSWVKPYPTLGDNVGVVIAARRIADRAEASAIERITIHQNAEFAAYPGTSYRGPFTRPAQAIASTAFAVAAMLAYGTIDYAMYERSLDDPVILRLIDRTSVVPHEDYAFVDGVVELDQNGDRLVGDASEEPRTTFYRDRAGARAAFATHLQSSDGGAEGFADRLFAAVDGGPAGGSIREVLREFAALT
jgi:2-methylcitrate dehydratase PrpD